MTTEFWIAAGAGIGIFLILQSVTVWMFERWLRRMTPKRLRWMFQKYPVRNGDDK